MTDTERLWTVEDCAAFLQRSVATLYEWSYKGTGPPVLKIGRVLRYSPGAVRTWALAQEKQPTPHP